MLVWCDAIALGMQLRNDPVSRFAVKVVNISSIVSVSCLTHCCRYFLLSSVMCVVVLLLVVSCVGVIRVST